MRRNCRLFQHNRPKADATASDCRGSYRGQSGHGLSILVDDDPAMGFNKRKMEDQRRQAAEKEAAARRATEKQILENAEYLVAVWNERQAKRMPMLFSPTIGAAIMAAGRPCPVHPAG
jgi:hypothetical protein